MEPVQNAQILKTSHSIICFDESVMLCSVYKKKISPTEEVLKFSQTKKSQVVFKSSVLKNPSIN